MASDIQDLKVFLNSGLDRDSDILAIEGGNSRYRRNVVLTEENNWGVISTSKGTVLIPNTLPTPINDPNQTVGFVEDKEFRAAIYFLYNAPGNHCVYWYNADTGTVQTLIDSVSVLGLASDELVDAVIVGDGDDRVLIWTTPSQPPRMLNISLALSGWYNFGSRTDDEIIEMLSFYKAPFTGNIFPNYTTFGGEPNFLKALNFQFSIRLKFFDKTFSVISPYSVIDMPSFDTMAVGRLTDEGGNNAISITLTIDRVVGIVESYQLLFRITDVGGGNPGSWTIYDEYEFTTSGFQPIIYFKNEKSQGIISDAEAARLEDFVPQLAPHVEAIDDNRLVFGDVTEGFDNIDPNDLDVDVDNEIITVISESNDGFQIDRYNFVNYLNNSVYTVGKGVNDDYYYQVQIYNRLTTTHSFYTVGSSFGLAENVPLEFIEDWVNSDVPDMSASFTGPNTLTLTSDGIDGSVGVFDVIFIVLDKTSTYPSFKTQSTYRFGIRYGYNGRVGPVQTNDDFLFTTSRFDNIVATPYCNYFISNNIEISHLAPVGATEYQIVSFGSEVDYFEEYMVFGNFDDPYDAAANWTIYVEGGDTVIRRDDMVNRFRKAYNDGFPYGMDIVEGDIIRVVGLFYNALPGTQGASKWVDIFSEVLDYRINSVTSTDIRISFGAIAKIIELGGSFNTGVMIQVIRNKSQRDQIAQEFSKVYQIDTATRYHMGDSDQTSLLPAVVNLDGFGDVFKTKQVYLNAFNWSDYYGTYGGRAPYMYGWMEKPMVSLYYDSYPTSFGRPNAVVDDSRQLTYRKIRWGGKYIDEAGVNFLSKFEVADERDVDDRNGMINKIQQIGNVLKVYQQRKVNSFYLKTTSSIDALGSDTFVFSDDVMSVARQSVDDYGCTHFGSYQKNVRHAYFYDQVNGCVVRDSPNGFEEISGYGLHGFFEELSRQSDLFEKVDVVGGWDEDLKMYMITFRQFPSIADRFTLGFHEPTNKWISFYDFVPEYYGKISGDQLLSFDEGSLNRHNENETRCNFYGQQYDYEFWVHSNEQPFLNKIFDSVEINSVTQWACPDDDSIIIERPIAMQSRLLSGKFRLQEGVYRAEFLRDSLNGGSSPVRLNLLNGRFLRGKEITLKLKGSETTAARLESVLIKSTISK